MNLRKIALIGMGLLVLSACKEKYDGTLDVYSPVPVNVDLNSLSPGQKVRLQPEVTGQPFIAEASYDRSRSTSSETSAVESCTYNTTEYRCWKVKLDRDCREIDGKSFCRPSDSRRECGHVTVTHYGQQNVRYYYDYTEHSLRLDIIKNGALIAKLSGENLDSDKRYTYQGTCR